MAKDVFFRRFLLFLSFFIIPTIFSYEKCTYGTLYYYCQVGSCCDVDGKWYCTNWLSSCDQIRKLHSKSDRSEVKTTERPYRFNTKRPYRFTRKYFNYKRTTQKPSYDIYEGRTYTYSSGYYYTYTSTKTNSPYKSPGIWIGVIAGISFLSMLSYCCKVQCRKQQSGHRGRILVVAQSEIYRRRGADVNPNGIGYTTLPAYASAANPQCTQSDLQDREEGNDGFNNGIVSCEGSGLNGYRTTYENEDSPEVAQPSYDTPSVPPPSYDDVTPREHKTMDLD